MGVWRMSLRRTQCTIISWNGSYLYDNYVLLISLLWYIVVILSCLRRQRWLIGFSPSNSIQSNNCDEFNLLQLFPGQACSKVMVLLGFLWCMSLCFLNTRHLSRDMTKPTIDCAPNKLRSVWTSAQSDQSSLSTWRKLGSFAAHGAHSKDWTDVQLLCLCWAHTHFVGFVMSWLISCWVLPCSLFSCLFSPV